MRLFQQQSFSQEQIFALGCFCVQNKVYAASDQLCHHQRRTANKSAEIKAVQQIFAHLKLFLKLWISNFGNVHIAISGLVTLGIGDQHTRAAELSTYFCVLTIRKHLLKMRFERSGRGQEPSRGHKFSILENVVLHRDFTSSMRLHFRSDLVGACLPQTLLIIRALRHEWNGVSCLHNFTEELSNRQEVQ